jgi:hypothetical protein
MEYESCLDLSLKKQQNTNFVTTLKNIISESRDGNIPYPSFKVRVVTLSLLEEIANG